MGREVQRVTNDDSHVPSRLTGSRTAVDVSNLPRRTVSGGLVDELRCKVNLGVVRPGVVLRVVFERTWSYIVDGHVDVGNG